MVVRALARGDERTDKVFHALADATRRDIVLQVMREEHSVSALARRYPMSFAAVQKHVAVLHAAGLVTKRKQGREQLVRGDVTTIHQAHGVLDELEAVWRRRLERFGQVLDEDGRAGDDNDDDDDDDDDNGNDEGANR